ncbi:MAG: DUF177 domain-containing protein [Lachnospiraceae bacterium]|nr:DUF177 domain-containing protein [Lachnospiraceae bacterium]
MLVNLTDVFSSDGKTVTKEFPYEVSELIYEGEHFSVKECSPVLVKLTNIAAKKVLVEAKVKLAVLLNCDRCLSEVEHVFDLQIEREVISPDKATSEELEEQDAFMEGYELNIDRLIDNEIMTSWPMKVLCRPDCKGLCPVCGKDLNTGACGCDTFVPDPRMAAIMDVFNANKEV